MFVVDDLMGWLIGRLADAGYQKLITLVRGSDQDRALKAAVTAAVQATVSEIDPSDEEEAERVAEQINKAFRRREPIPLPMGQPTLLEALQAGIAGQLSVLDDSGQPVVSLPGVPVSEVAAKLTGHLVRQIQIRGSQPGPLTPLAGQLNDDLTHLQGQRLEGMLAQVLDLLGHDLAPPGGTRRLMGWPLADVRDPFALEVHRPVELDVRQPGLPVLPVYVPRKHDAALAEVVAAAADGTSGIAVLVSGSSTGKTRACWEALELLRDLEPGWRLWHPIDPSPRQAALAGLRGVGPRTVVWLNEAQNYLRSSDGAGEQVAAGLRELVRSPGQGPVLVLATLWPDFWAELTVRSPGGMDPYKQARELLVGHAIPVPDAFPSTQLRELQAGGDPRLAQAAAGSRDGQVIQYLAGAPELLDRYRTASSAARALIDAAMDAARLGMRGALPRAFLEAAAPGYLTDTEWELLPGDWLERALDDTASPCKGVRGPLTPIRPRPVPGALAGPGDQSAWQLADYLDQYGRHARREEIPPEAFWAAAASYADPADLIILAEAAEARGLYRDAARLNKQACAHGDAMAGSRLVPLLHSLRPGDPGPADWAAVHASLDDGRALGYLLRALREADADGQFIALASRAAVHVSLDDPRAVAELLDTLRRAGAANQIAELLARDPAGNVSLDDPDAVASLVHELHWGVRSAGQITTLLARDPAAQVSFDDPYAGYPAASLLSALHDAGATGQVTALASRAAAQASVDDPYQVRSVLDALRKVGATEQITALASRAAAHTSLDRPGRTVLVNAMREAGATEQITALASRAAQARVDDPGDTTSPGSAIALLSTLNHAGAAEQFSALASRAAAHSRLDDPRAVTELLRALFVYQATRQITTLLDRDPAAQVSLHDPDAVARLLDVLGAVEATGQMTALLDRDPAAQVSLDDARAVARLLDALRMMGATSHIAALLDRDPAAQVSLDDPDGVTALLDALRKVEATGQVTTLLDRGPAAHVSLDNPRALGYLLRALQAAGATEQVTALGSRAAAHVSLDDGHAAIELLGVLLHMVGAPAQATELIERLPAAGQFQFFCMGEDRKSQFRFGREADGSPAKRWAWTNLGSMISTREDESPA